MFRVRYIAMNAGNVMDFATIDDAVAFAKTVIPFDESVENVKADLGQRGRYSAVNKTGFLDIFATEFGR